MREKELKEKLRKNRVPLPSEEEREKVKRLVCLEQKQVSAVPEISFVRRMWQQIPYISKSAWMVQACITILAVAALEAEEVWSTGVVLAAFAPLIGIAVFPELMKSFYYEMWELEQSCRFNLREIVAARLLIFGLADLAGVLLICGLTVPAGKTTAEELLVYFLIPFELSNAVYLLAVRVAGRRCSAYLLTALGLLMAAAAGGFAEICGRLREAGGAFSGSMAAAFSAGSFLLLAFMVTRLFRAVSGEQITMFTETEYGRENLWN